MRLTKSTTSTGSTRRSSSLPSSNKSWSAAFTAAVAPVSGMCLAASGSRKHQQLAVAISVEALVWTPVHTLQPFKLAVHCVVDNLLVHVVSFENVSFKTRCARREPRLQFSKSCLVINTFHFTQPGLTYSRKMHAAGIITYFRLGLKVCIDDIFSKPLWSLIGFFFFNLKKKTPVSSLKFATKKYLQVVHFLVIKLPNLGF